MISNNSVVIFGYPRSGTKLLANVLEQQGYFNFGEFFEIFAADFNSNSLAASRRDCNEQLIMFTKYTDSPHEIDFKHSILRSDRITKFTPYINDAMSSVTVFHNTVEAAPELFNLLHSRYFLCTRRQNKLDQLISWSITFHQKNYNGEIESKQMKIDLIKFERSFFQLKKTERIQDYLVSIGQGMIVDFDKLITGSLDLGFSYEVTSSDQHHDLASLITNYDEVLAKFDHLNTTYSSY